MAKTLTTYWNTFDECNNDKWETIPGTDGLLEQLTLAFDEATGDYTRLTRFKPGADTSLAGSKCHDYPEEVFVISGSLYDQAFDLWLKPGDYTSRPPGEVHGPFRSDEGCVVIEISCPSQALHELTEP